MSSHPMRASKAPASRAQKIWPLRIQKVCHHVSSLGMYSMVLS